MRPFDVNGVAAHWGCSTTFVYAEIASGALQSWKLGRNYRISVAAMEAYECQNLTASESLPAGDQTEPPIGPMLSDGTDQTVDAFAYRSARLIRQRHRP